MEPEPKPKPKCKCIIKTGKRKGKQCRNRALLDKTGSLVFCGLHQLCTRAVPSPPAGLPKSVHFKLPNCNLNVFNQVLNICWFQASIVALFLCDEGRDIIWRQLYEMEKHGDYYVPRKLQLGKGRRRLSLAHELIRQNIEISMDTMLSAKPLPDQLIPLQRQQSARACDIGMQHLLFMDYVEPDGGCPIQFLEDITKGLKGITFEVHHEVDTVFSFTSSAFILSFINIDDYAHVVCFFRCRSRWYFYDNEGAQGENLYLPLPVYEKQYTVTELLSHVTTIAVSQLLEVDIIAIDFEYPDIVPIIEYNDIGASKVANYLTSLTKDELYYFIDNYYSDTMVQQHYDTIFARSSFKTITLELVKLVGATAVLSYALSNGFMLDDLVSLGANINLIDRPIFRAHHPDSLRFLVIDHGIDINQQDKYGNTRLMIEVQAPKNNRDIVDMLLYLDTDLDIKNKAGQTAYKLATSYYKNLLSDL